MHDPSVVVADVPSPFPHPQRWKRKGAPAWGIATQRRTNTDNLGERVYPWWRLAGYDLYLFGSQWRLHTLLTIWHNEPGGADSGTVCGRLPNGTNLTLSNIAWAIVHRSHLRIQWQLGRSTWRWLTVRCSDCGQRLGRREAWFSLAGWDDPRSGHGTCATIRRLKSQRDDALKYAMGIATDTERWRVEYDINGVALAFAAAEMGLDQATAQAIKDAAV